MTPAELETSLANLKLERDAIVLYDRLAALERDPRRGDAFRTIAANERRHAGIWADRLTAAGAVVPPVGGPRARIRFILLVARVFGTRSVSDLVQALEGDEEEAYLDQDDPRVASIVEDEREHAAIWKRLSENDAGAVAVAATASPALAGVGGVLRPTSPQGLAGGEEEELEGPARSEAWHRAGQSGTLRATIFGVSDGLVSNLSLVMGVVGATADNQVVVLAGIAGLLAGAFSMGAGEWISMTSQKELFERQIELEREELRIMPEQEEAELAAMYRRKGISAGEARRLAAQLMQDPDVALDTKAREELGLDPDELGSPWGAATSSFLAFTGGAFVPLVAFLVSHGTPAFVASLVLSAVALFLVGGGVSLLTGKSFLWSGLRQVIIGLAAAAVTYGVGTVIGVAAG
ncbi:MAG TPA: VIT1/CCC1 transporter family protein [Candidatus Limnocylindrales bacterium]|nr:VIT1/CCC1 transporter family protein [Candidatus Limnocylindrales bacterium]